MRVTKKMLDDRKEILTVVMIEKGILKNDECLDIVDNIQGKALGVNKGHSHAIDRWYTNYCTSSELLEQMITIQRVINDCKN